VEKERFKMTKREVMNAILKAQIEGLNGEDVEGIKTFAENELAKMDAANAKRKSKPTKAQVENAPLIKKLVEEVLTEEPQTAAEVAEVLGVTPAKVASLMRTVIANGDGHKQEVKVKGKGKRVGYTL